MAIDELPFAASDLELDFHHTALVGLQTEPSYRFLHRWGVRAVTRDDEGDRVLYDVGYANVTVIDVYDAMAAAEHLPALLDAEDTDWGRLGSAALTPQAIRSFSDDYEVFVDRVLFLDKVGVKEQFRGHDLGLVIAGMAIRTLGRGCAAAYCDPAPTEGAREGPKHDAAKKALARHWARLAFEPFDDGILVVSLDHPGFESSLDQILHAQ